MPAPYTTTHSSIPITKSVYNRLPFLADTEDNDTLISNFIMEMMGELNACFKIEEDLVGDEANYTVAQKACIADFVAYYILLLYMATSTGAGSGSSEEESGSMATFISAVKAGSVEVEWEQFDLKSGAAGFVSSGENLLNYFLSSAIRKAAAMGCVILINPDGTLGEIQASDYSLPVKVGRWLKDFPLGTDPDIIERG